MKKGFKLWYTSYSLYNLIKVTSYLNLCLFLSLSLFHLWMKKYLLCRIVGVDKMRKCTHHAQHVLGTHSQCPKMAGPFLAWLASDLLFDVGHTGDGAAASSTTQAKCGGQF